MRLVLLTALSVIPGIAWVWFFYRQDADDREPLPLLARTFLAGMLAVAPAALLEIAFRDALLDQQNPWLRLLNLILFVGLVEEFVKFVAFYVSVHSARAFNEPLDAIVYAVAAALGFATVENLLYASTFGLTVVPVRALITSLAHASFSGLVGYYAGLVRFAGKPWTMGLYGLVLSAVLHGLYNFVIVHNELPAVLALPMVYLVYRFLTAKIRRARSLSLL